MNAIIKYNERLDRYTTFKIGGPAEIFVQPDNKEDFIKLISEYRARGRKIRFLGGGSNLLISDGGVDGIVFYTKKLDNLEIRGTQMIAGGGVNLSHIVQQAESAGLSGLEPLVGIPGTLAGAVKMNAGGRWGCIGDIIKSVTAVTGKGELKKLQRDELCFQYRRSNIDEDAVLEVELELRNDSRIKIKDRVERLIEEKRTSQPISKMSAGCIFKNPPGKSAGELIDRAGLKGLKVGGALVSEKHANFIVNTGKTRAREVLKLIELIQKGVEKRFGVKLETEVEIWN